MTIAAVFELIAVLNPDVTEWSKSGQLESNGAAFDQAGFHAALVIGFRMVDASESDC